eukprot:1414908-Prymnesium_polylepis.1
MPGRTKRERGCGFRGPAHRAQREVGHFSLDAARDHLPPVDDVGDGVDQRLRRRPDLVRVRLLLGRRVRRREKLRHAEDAVHVRPDHVRRTLEPRAVQRRAVERRGTRRRELGVRAAPAQRQWRAARRAPAAVVIGQREQRVVVVESVHLRREVARVHARRRHALRRERRRGPR